MEFFKGVLQMKHFNQANLEEFLAVVFWFWWELELTGDCGYRWWRNTRASWGVSWKTSLFQKVRVPLSFLKMAIETSTLHCRNALGAAGDNSTHQRAGVVCTAHPHPAHQPWCWQRHKRQRLRGGCSYHHSRHVSFTCYFFLANANIIFPLKCCVWPQATKSNYFVLTGVCADKPSVRIGFRRCSPYATL